MILPTVPVIQFRIQLQLLSISGQKKDISKEAKEEQRLKTEITQTQLGVLRTSGWEDFQVPGEVSSGGS